MPRLSDNLDELAIYVQRVAAALGIPPAHVEKDFWLTQAMRACIDTAAPEGVEVILKGGTSLSKAFGLIKRFSEDVDIVLVFPRDTSARTRHNLMRRIASTAGKALFCTPIVDGSKSETGVKRPVFLKYPSSVDPEGTGLREEGVLLELGTRGGTLPTSLKDLEPLVAEHAVAVELPGGYEDFGAVPIRVLDPARTLIEKLLILHDAASGEDDARIRETARHYYDVHQLLGNSGTRAAVQQHGVSPLVDDVASRSREADLPRIDSPPGGLGASPAFDVEKATIARDQYENRVIPELLWPGADTPSFRECCERVLANRSLLS